MRHVARICSLALAVSALGACTASAASIHISKVGGEEGEVRVVDSAGHSARGVFISLVRDDGGGCFDRYPLCMMFRANRPKELVGHAPCAETTYLFSQRVVMCPIRRQTTLKISMGDGADEVATGNWSDMFRTTTRISLGAGSDELDADHSARDFRAFGGSGADDMEWKGDSFDAYLNGGADGDRLEGGLWDGETLAGGAGPDRLFGRQDEDLLLGGRGRDFCHGGTDSPSSIPGFDPPERDRARNCETVRGVP